VPDPAGVRHKHIRNLSRSEWQVLIPDQHPGFIDWKTYEANQARIARNTLPGPQKAASAVRVGSALLQGLASCGHCGCHLRTHYRGRHSAPGYHCPGSAMKAVDTVPLIPTIVWLRVGPSASENRA
jgi:hypothetical protein